MRGNLIAATVGTIVGNPWTFPLIFYLDYKIGTTIYYISIENYEFKISFFMENFEDLFYPTLLGSVPLALIVWFLTFYTVKKILNDTGVVLTPGKVFDKKFGSKIIEVKSYEQY